MSGGLIINQLLSLASTGLYVLIAVALVVVGLTNVRRVHAIAGLCLAGAGAAVGFGAVVRQVSGLMSFAGPTMWVVSQALSVITGFFAGVLAVAGIFLLAGALKQGTPVGR